MLKDHEKFWAFMALGLAVFTLAVMAYFNPIADGSGNQRIIDAAMGGLLLALGAAGQALFRTGSASENKQIGEAAVTAMQNSSSGINGNQQDKPPAKVEVVNEPNNPVPTETHDEQLPPMLRENA